jgi:hypothetical protein
MMNHNTITRKSNNNNNNRFGDRWYRDSRRHHNLNMEEDLISIITQMGWLEYLVEVIVTILEVVMAIRKTFLTMVEENSSSFD